MVNGDDIRTLADLPARLRKRLLEGKGEPVFQLLPPLDARDREALRESVAERGIRVPVELDPNGRVLDGHYRLEVAAELKLEPGQIPVTVRDDLQGEEDVLEYVLEVNLGRRHLTREGRRKIAAELRGRGWSYPRIADRLGISVGTAHGDVQAFNSENLSDGDELPETVEGRDGKRYPATFSRDTSSPDGGGSGGRRRPGHAQGRSRGSAAGSRNRSGGRRRRQADRPASAESESESECEPDRDPRIDLLNQADRLLSQARRMTPEEETDVRDELEVLGDRCADLVAEIAGAGDGWVV